MPITWRNPTGGSAEAGASLINQGVNTASDALAAAAGVVDDYVETDKAQGDDLLRAALGRQTLDTVGSDEAAAELQAIAASRNNNVTQSLLTDGLRERETALRTEYTADTQFQDIKDEEAAEPHLSKLRSFSFDNDKDGYEKYLATPGVEESLRKIGKFTSTQEEGRKTFQSNKDRAKAKEWDEVGAAHYDIAAALYANGKEEEGNAYVTKHKDLFARHNKLGELTEYKHSASTTYLTAEEKRDSAARSTLLKKVRAEHDETIANQDSVLEAARQDYGRELIKGMVAKHENLKFNPYSMRFEGLPTDEEGLLAYRDSMDEVIKNTEMPMVFDKMLKDYETYLNNYTGERGVKLTREEKDGMLADMTREFNETLMAKNPELQRQYDTDKSAILRSEPGVENTAAYQAHFNPTGENSSKMVVGALTDVLGSGDPDKETGFFAEMFKGQDMSGELAEFLGTGDGRKKLLRTMREWASNGITGKGLDGHTIPVNREMLIDMTLGISNNLLETWDDSSSDDAKDAFILANKEGFNKFLKVKNKLSALDARYASSRGEDYGTVFTRQINTAINAARVNESAANSSTGGNGDGPTPEKPVTLDEVLNPPPKEEPKADAAPSEPAVDLNTVLNPEEGPGTKNKTNKVSGADELLVSKGKASAAKAPNAVASQIKKVVQQVPKKRAKAATNILKNSLGAKASEREYTNKVLVALNTPIGSLTSPLDGLPPEELLAALAGVGVDVTAEDILSKFRTALSARKGTEEIIDNVTGTVAAPFKSQYDLLAGGLTQAVGAQYDLIGQGADGLSNMLSAAAKPFSKEAYAARVKAAKKKKRSLP